MLESNMESLILYYTGQKDSDFYSSLIVSSIEKMSDQLSNF